jgi:hypothetical protein
LINFTQLDYSSLSNKIGSILSYMTLNVCILFPILVGFILYLKNSGKLSKAEYEEKYGTITEGLREDPAAGYLTIL